MLDNKDEIIYEHLLHDARYPVKKLAEIIHSSKATVINRIKKLEKDGYISSYDAIINWQKLPFIKKVYHIKLDKIREEYDLLKGQKCVFSIIQTAGLYKLQVWCFFKTRGQCSEFERLIKKYDYIEVEIEKLEFPKVSFFNKKIKTISKNIKDQTLKLDKIDIKLMEHLALGGARDSLIKMGDKLKIPYDTAHYRFNRLLKAGYFSRLVAQPGKNPFTLQTTIILLRYSKEVNADKIYDKLSSIEQIISLAKANDNSILIHFNSLNFQQYQNKLDELCSLSDPKKTDVILISHWKDILLNNRYPLEFLI